MRARFSTFPGCSSSALMTKRQKQRTKERTKKDVPLVEFMYLKITYSHAR